MQIELTGEQVHALMLQMPTEARAVGSGVFYDGAELIVPDAYADAAKGVMAKAGWDSYVAPRLATTYALMSALTDAQRTAYASAKPWDQRLFAARDTPWPEGNEKIARIATALGTTAAAWFDAALSAAA